MTELLEKRIADVIDSIDQGIVTLGDAQFLVQVVKAQAKRMNEIELEAGYDILKDLTKFIPRFHYDEDVYAIKFLMERARKLLEGK